MEEPESLRAYKETSFGSWEEGDASLFWVRGPDYTDDREKVQATGPVFRLIHLDLFQGPYEELNVFPKMRHGLPDNVGVLKKDREFYFIMNFLIRAKDRTLDKKKKIKTESWINWIFYFALPKSARKDKANAHFFKCWELLLSEEDEKSRNHRVKVIPCVADGPWIVRAAIGGGKESHKGVVPTLIGEKVTTSYFQGNDYIEIDYNTAIDSVAVASAKLAFEHSKKLIVDCGVVLQGEELDQLPEKILGCVRCSFFVINEALLFPGIKPDQYRMKKSKESKEEKEKHKKEKEEKNDS